MSTQTTEPPPGVHQNAVLALIDRMQELRAGEEANSSRDFGRGVAWTVQELTRVLTALYSEPAP